MTLTTIKIDGMMCDMCEAHINDALRRAFSVKKVISSHKKGETVLITAELPDSAKIRTVIEETGYRVLEVSHKPYVKKGLFSFFGK